MFPPNIARYSAWNDASLTGSGPLGERTGLTLAGRYTRADRFERFDPTELRSRLFTLSGNLVSQIGGASELRVLAALGAGSSPYAGRARFGSRDVVQDERFVHLQSTWQRRPGEGHAWSVSAGVSLADFDPDTSGGAAGAASSACSTVPCRRSSSQGGALRAWTCPGASSPTSVVGTAAVTDSASVPA